MRLFCSSVVASSLLGGVIIFVDQLCKYLARTQLVVPKLITPFFGLEYFANTGVAFGLPIPNSIVIVATPLLLILFIVWLEKHSRTLFVLSGSALFLAGAISNYVDRVLFGFTVDYLRIFTGVINIADLAVIVGILLLLRDQNKKAV